MSTNGQAVSRFESELAAYCGAKYCVAASNGTVTLSAALIALGIKPGDRVAVPPLTMSATTIAVLNVGAVPVFCDVDPKTWLIDPMSVTQRLFSRGDETPWGIPVSLYGLHWPTATPWTVDDAAQTLRSHGGAGFTSLSFQASKILTLGEGGALLTNDEGLAARARSYLSLGYKMDATQARIDSSALRSPTFDRHHMWPAVNGRMNDITATAGLKLLDHRQEMLGERWVGNLLAARRYAANDYARAIEGCDWLVPQHVPEGYTHDMWSYAVAADTQQRAEQLADVMAKHGAERPYFAWKLTYHEPAFRHLALAYPTVEFGKDIGVAWRTTGGVSCPVAEDLQPRILAFQTNSLASAERNALALRRAIEEIDP